MVESVVIRRWTDGSERALVARCLYTLWLLVVLRSFPLLSSPARPTLFLLGNRQRRMSFFRKRQPSQSSNNVLVANSPSQALAQTQQSQAQQQPRGAPQQQQMGQDPRQQRRGDEERHAPLLARTQMFLTAPRQPCTTTAVRPR